VAQLLDFDAFESDFRDACIEGVRLLAREHNQTPYYAVCVYADSFDGTFGLYANTEAHFAQTLHELKATYPEACATAMQVKESKYNCGDWAYQSVGLPEDFAACVAARLQTWSSRIQDLSYNNGALTTQHHQRFDEIACRIALSTAMANELAAVQKTEDFLVTVSGHDEPALASIYRPLWYVERGSLDDFDPYAYSVDA
jgi:hypothetical protein